MEIYPDGHAAKFLFIWLFQIWINTFQRYSKIVNELQQGRVSHESFVDIKHAFYLVLQQYLEK